MSFVTTHPKKLATAVGNVAGFGSAMSAAKAAPGAPTMGVVPAAAEEVSALAATQIAAHASRYQTANAHTAANHGQFVIAAS
jgi:hypothetical protein